MKDGNVVLIEFVLTSVDDCSSFILFEPFETFTNVFLKLLVPLTPYCLNIRIIDVMLPFFFLLLKCYFATLKVILKDISLLHVYDVGDIHTRNHTQSLYDITSI